MQSGYEIVDFAEVEKTKCPCGTSSRGLMEVSDYPGSIHRVEISEDAKLHYHKELTETYFFLDCKADAAMQLDDEIIPVKPGMLIMIRPGTRHKAIGNMTILNIVYPKFDPADEWFD